MPRPAWPQEHSDALKRFIDDGCSFSIAVKKINACFNTSYSRNAAIGRASRMGLCQAAFVRRRATDTIRTRRPPPPPRPAPKPVLPARPKQDEIEIRCAEVEPRHVALIDLAPGQCRYPYGDNIMTFCGHVAYPASSYCEAHLLLCTRPKNGNTGGERHDQSIRLRKRLPSPIALANAWEDA